MYAKYHGKFYCRCRTWKSNCVSKKFKEWKYYGRKTATVFFSVSYILGMRDLETRGEAPRNYEANALTRGRALTRASHDIPSGPS